MDRFSRSILRARRVVKTFLASLKTPMHSILVREEIENCLSTGDIVLEPRLHGVAACHVDIRLDNYFGLFRHTGEAVLDPGRQSRAIHFEDLPFFSTPFYIQPGSFVLAQTLEFVAIAPNIIAHLDGRSSLGRRGLVVHATAGWIDPGWEGHITLELANLGAMPLALYPGMKIGRLVFQRVSATESYDGQFLDQLRIREPQLDHECTRIAEYAAHIRRKEVAKA